MSFGYGSPTTPDDDDHDQLQFIMITANDGEWDIAIAIGCRLVFYIAIMTLLVMIVTLVIKLLRSLSIEENAAAAAAATGGAPAATETNRLLPKEVVQLSYGTCEGDEESGKCSVNKSEDLYDGKVCVICYDQRRNCFFIPCGHCATCCICARRITEGESKTCPVCRRYIHKVRKLLI